MAFTSQEKIKEQYSMPSTCGVYFPTGFKKELKGLLMLFVPCLLTNLFRFLNPLISLIMCGHLSKLDFGAASLAYSIINIFGENIDLGFSTAFDTLFAQIYGSNQKRKMGLLLQRAIIVMTLIYVVLMCVHLNMEPILIFLKQDPHISKLTARYLLIYLPGLFFDFQFLAVSRYLQNQNIVYPMMISAMMSNIFNVTSQYILLFIFGYGIDASAATLSISNFLMFILQLGYVLISGVYKDTWDGFSLKDSMENWKILFLLGLPGIFMFSLKEWTFEVSIFIAGSINDTQLGAQSVAFQCVTVAFTLIVGLGISTTIRVGQYLGSHQLDSIKTFLRTAAIVAVTCSTLCFAVMLIFRNYIGGLFTSDLDIQNEASTLLIYASVFELIDIILVIFIGVLKATGRQFIGACVMFVCHYLIGIPIGVTLVYVTKLNVKGMWIGLIIATAIEGLIFAFIMYRIDWEKECLKAIANTEQVKVRFDIDILQNEAIEKNSKPGCIINKDQNKSFKRTAIIRSVSISAVLLLLVIAILCRIFLAK